MNRKCTAMPLAIAMLVSGSLLGGCEKAMEATPSEPTAFLKQNAYEQKDNYEVVSEKQLDDILQGLPEFMADQEHVLIEKADGGYRVALDTDHPIDPPTEDRTVCSSTKVTWDFANCVKNYVLANGCGMLQHGAGGWTLSNCPN